MINLETIPEFLFALLVVLCPVVVCITLVWVIYMMYNTRWPRKEDFKVSEQNKPYTSLEVFILSVIEMANKHGAKSEEVREYVNKYSPSKEAYELAATLIYVRNQEEQDV